MNAELTSYQQHLLGSAVRGFTLLAKECVLNIPVEAYSPGFLRHVRVAIEYLVSHDTPVTIDTLTNNLSYAGKGDCREALVELAGMGVSDANMQAFNKKILDWYHCNEAVIIMRQAIGDISGISDGSEALSILMRRLKRITAKTSIRQAPVLIGDLARQTVADAKRRRDTGVVEGYQTGIPGIDTAFGRLMPGDLVVIAARPGMGKTELALGVNKALCKSMGIAAMIVNLEMSNAQIGERMLAGACDLSVDTLDDVDLLRVDSVMNKLEQAAEDLDQYALYIREMVDVAPDQLCAIVESEAEQIGNLGLLTIDHLGLLRLNSHNLNQSIGEATRSFKMLAKRLGIPVILLAQLNRSLEMRENKRPINSDLRDSGSIEQDADKIIFIYRDSYYNPGSAWGNVAELINGKRRRGEASGSYMSFECGHFVDAPADFTPPDAQQDRKGNAKSRLPAADVLRGIAAHEY